MGLFLLWLLPAITVFGQDSGSVPGVVDSQENPRLAMYDGRPRVVSVKLGESEKITLDGRLDEPVWKRASPAKDFVQQDPNNGRPPTELTEVAFLSYGRPTLSHPDSGKTRSK